MNDNLPNAPLNSLGARAQADAGISATLQRWLHELIDWFCAFVFLSACAWFAIGVAAVLVSALFV